MKKSKFLRNMLLFLAIIVLTFYIIFKDQSITEIFGILQNVKIEYIIIAILSIICYFVCDTLNIGRTLKKLGEKSTFIKNFKYSLIGFFFSSVTPAASGGQPMQIYYMNKENISVANSTLTLLINLACMQVVTISLAIISLFFNLECFNPVITTLFIVGILLNITALALLVISIVSKRMTNGLIKIFLKILKFFKVKNLEEKEKGIYEELGKYQYSTEYIKSNKKLILKTLLTTYIQYFFYYSISYWVYRSFGFNQLNILKIMSMQAILFGTVSGIPSPGAVGVSEGGFIEIFRVAYEKEMINGAMLLSRGINFYLFVIISSIVVMVCTLKTKKADKLNEKIENEIETEKVELSINEGEIKND